MARVVANVYLVGAIDVRGRHGGVEKRGGGKPHEWHPSQKGALDPPSNGTFSTPLRCRCWHDRADQKLFWRGSKIFGRARSLERFPPPYVLHPPISRPNRCLRNNVSSRVLKLNWTRPARVANKTLSRTHTHIYIYVYIYIYTYIQYIYIYIYIYIDRYRYRYIYIYIYIFICRTPQLVGNF